MFGICYVLYSVHSPHVVSDGVERQINSPSPNEWYFFSFRIPHRKAHSHFLDWSNDIMCPFDSPLITVLKGICTGLSCIEKPRALTALKFETGS